MSKILLRGSLYKVFTKVPSGNVIIGYCRYSSTDLKKYPKLSYAHGASNVPLLSSTIGKLVDEATEQHGDKEAVVVCHQNVRKNFFQLRNDVDDLATGLLALGLQKGDRIGIWAPNMYEWVVTQFATARFGSILVNINPAYQADELAYCLKKVGVKALIAAQSFKTQDYYQLFRSVVPEIDNCTSKTISSKIFPHLKTLVLISEKDYDGAHKYCDVMKMGGNTEWHQLMQAQNDIQFDEPVNIQFTSGTTGNPKGTVLSHHGMVNNSYFIGRKMNYHLEPHRTCIPVPLYHCIGNVFGSLGILTHGICAVFPSPSFMAEPTLQAISNERCTAVYGTPTMFIDMLQHPHFGKYQFSALKTGIMAGAPCPEELIRNVTTKMNAKDLIVAYGTTETSPAITASSVNDSLATRATKIGKPLDHAEVKVVDSSNKIVPLSTAGELCTRGFLTMLGYWDDEAKTREVLKPEGWYHTGDLVIMFEDGNFEVVGRIKDMIIRGGENIFPREIEDFLHTHPNIADVHVVGVPDSRLGEELCAWIKVTDGTKMTEEDVKKFCRGKISHFKIPRYIRFVSQFPTTISGKVQKYIIRKEMVKELDL